MELLGLVGPWPSVCHSYRPNGRNKFAAKSLVHYHRGISSIVLCFVETFKINNSFSLHARNTTEWQESSRMAGHGVGKYNVVVGGRKMKLQSVSYHLRLTLLRHKHLPKDGIMDDLSAFMAHYDIVINS